MDFNKLFCYKEKIQLEKLVDEMRFDHLKMAENKKIVKDLNEPPLKKEKTDKNVEKNKRFVSAYLKLI